MSRNFDFALAASKGVKVLPDITTLPNVGDTVVVQSITSGDVHTAFASPQAASGGPFLPLSGGTVSGETIFTQTTTGNFSPMLLAHGGLYGVPAQVGTNWTQIGLDVDYADAAASGGPGGINYLYVGGTMKAGFTGHRSGLNSFMNVNGTPGSNSTTKFITSIVGWTVCDVADNGQNNSLFGGNLLVDMHPTATSWGGVCGLEVDITCQAGSSVNLKEGIKVVIGANDTVQGASVDAAMGILMAAGTPGTGGWKVGLTFGGASGVWGMLPSGTLIGTSSTALGGRAYATAYGIDFGAVSFSSAAFRSTGLLINGAGGIVQSGTASSDTDLARHLNMDGAGAYGFNYHTNSLNAVLGGGGLLRFTIGGVMSGYVNATGLNACAVGAGAPAAGSFTTLAASGAVSGAGFTALLAAPPAIGGTTPAAGNFTTLTASNWLNASYNASGLIPPAGSSGSLSWNASGGSAEVDYWNDFAGPTMSHTFWQRTGTSTKTRLLDIDPTGNVSIYGSLHIAGPTGPTWYTGTGLPGATAPIGSLYSRTDGTAGATLYISRGGGTWTAVAGV